MKQCFIFFTREIDSRNLPLIRKLSRELEPVASFYVLSYQERATEPHAATSPDDIQHIVISRPDLTELFSRFPVKYSDKSTWTIMPGNLDLAHLAFFLKHQGFDYYWFCEDDVRYTGNMSELIGRYSSNTADLLATNIRPIRDNWGHRKSLTGIDERLLSSPPLVCFLPFFRASHQFLITLQRSYLSGASGHHEISWPSVAVSENLKISDLNDAGEPAYRSSPQKRNLAPGTFTFYPPRTAAGKESNMLYHPVKHWKFVVQRRWHYITYNTYDLGRYYIRRIIRCGRKSDAAEPEKAL